MSADPTTMPAKPAAPGSTTSESPSWRGRLPENAGELTRLLDGAVADIDRLIAEAERRAEERLRLALRTSILEAFLPRFAERASRLRDLGEDDARAARWSDILEDERLRVAAALAELGVAPAAEPAPEVVVPADADPEPEPAPPSDPVAARDPGPLPDSSPAPALDEHEAAEDELRALVITLANEVDALEADACARPDPRWLKSEVEAIATTLRMKQAALPDMPDTLERSISKLFGTLSRIANELLVPNGQWVQWLRRDQEADWATVVAESVVTRDHERKRRAADKVRDKERRKEAERHEQAKRLGGRLYEEAIDALRAHLSSVPPDDRFFVAEAQEYLADLQRHLPFADARLEEALASLPVERREAMLAGRPLRPLRRWARKRLGDASPGADETPAAPEPMRTTASTSEARLPPEVEGLRSAYAGRNAVLVGGLADEHRRAAIEAHLGFSTVEWVEHDQAERADADTLARRIRAGRFHVAIVFVRFISHALFGAAREACRAAGVELVTVDRGLGAVSVCRAIVEERRPVATTPADAA